MQDSPPRPTLAARARGADRLIGPSILAALAALVASWALPFMTVERFLWLSEEVTVWRGIGELWDSGAYGLLLVVVLFCVVFPLLKLSVALYLWFLADPAALRGGGLLRLLDSLGKWSMLDVFVVALTVVALNVSLVSDVEVHAGIYVFTLAAILSMVLVRRVLTLAGR
ncbi:MAG: paraquat-inducible protein A [Rhodovibrionaceae bacterium]